MNILPEIHSSQIVLIVAPHAAREGMLEMAAGLARHGPVRVLDGGNQFNAYRVARAVRRHTDNLDGVLSRIQLARAFTCYQMEVMLQTAQPGPTPTLVFDLPASFYDENVFVGERRRLMRDCASHLRSLSRRAPVVVSARDVPSTQAEQYSLLGILRGAADQILEWEAPAPAFSQPRLL